LISKKNKDDWQLMESQDHAQAETPRFAAVKTTCSITGGEGAGLIATKGAGFLVGKKKLEESGRVFL